MITFDVHNRFTGAVQFTADIDCDDSASTSVKLGLAAMWAFRRGAVLRGAVLSGGTDLSFSRSNEDREGIPTAVICLECGAEGPWSYAPNYDSTKKACDDWNIREYQTGGNCA